MIRRVDPHMTHIGADHLVTVLGDQFLDQPDTVLVRGDLGLEIRPVIRQVPRRVRRAGEQRLEGRLIKLAGSDQAHVVDHDPFLGQRG